LARELPAGAAGRASTSARTDAVEVLADGSTVAGIGVKAARSGISVAIGGAKGVSSAVVREGRFIDRV
jgi:type IV secretory pathway TrbL component